MTEANAFDASRSVKHLTESGFTGKQAEALAEERIALVNASLLTKTGIAEVRAEIATVEAGVERSRQEMKADIVRVEGRIETLEAGLLKWLFGALIAQGGLIVALVELL